VSTEAGQDHRRRRGVRARRHPAGRRWTDRRMSAPDAASGQRQHGIKGAAVMTLRTCYTAAGRARRTNGSRGSHGSTARSWRSGRPWRGRSDHTPL